MIKKKKETHWAPPKGMPSRFVCTVPGILQTEFGQRSFWGVGYDSHFGGTLQIYCHEHNMGHDGSILDFAIEDAPLWALDLLKAHLPDAMPFFMVYADPETRMAWTSMKKAGLIK